jgi:uncharacterized protein YeaO (DUF488 family)
MQLYTSCFKLYGQHPGAVAISNGTRGYWHVRKYPPLIPSWKLVTDAKEGRISADEFDLAYLRELRAFDPRRVFDDLRDLHNDEPHVLLRCWESPGQPCHRRTAAAWLEAELGIEVPEVDPSWRFWSPKRGTQIISPHLLPPD